MSNTTTGAVIAAFLSERQLSNSAEGIESDLADSGLLVGGWALFPNPTQATINVLGCRMSWPDALALACALDNAGRLVRPGPEADR